MLGVIRLIGWLIIACEISFWGFALSGLTARYLWKKKKLSVFLLICSPIVDFLLLIVTVYDLKNGAVATTVHGVAAVYIGVSVAFGKMMIKWADGIFNYRYGDGNKPMKITYGKIHAKNRRRAWYRHLLAWSIGGGILIGIMLYMNNFSQTELLFNTFRYWSIILLIDFVISFSYIIFPKKENCFI